MRSISSSLLSAASRWGGEPTCLATVHNRRLRWSRIVNLGAGNTAPCAMCHHNGALYRVCSDSAGWILWQKISDPENGNWAAWNVIKYDGVAYSDVAIAADPANSGYLRILYVRSDGANVKASYSESTDDGATWSSTADLSAGHSTPLYLAADHTYALLQHDATVGLYSAAWGGGWTSLGTAASGIGTRHGVGLAHNPDDATLYAAMCYDGVLTWRVYDLTTSSWGALVSLDPAEQAAPADMQPHEPAMAYVGCDNRLAAIAFIDSNGGSPATWDQPVVRLTLDAVHFGDEVALDMQTTLSNHHRVSLAYDASTRTLYAANEGQVCRSRLYDATDEQMVLQSGLCLRYRYRKEGHRPARAELLLLDPDGELKTFGQADEVAEAIQPLAELSIARGYRTGAGLERVALPRLYITQAAYRTGVGDSDPAGTLEIAATDALGLLDLWSPQRYLIWYNKTVAWLLAELCGRVGLRSVVDGSSIWSKQLASFTLAPTRTLRQGVGDLLRLAGGVAYVDANDKVHAIDLANYSPSAQPTIGAQNEILQGIWGAGIPRPTSVLVSSESVAGHRENRSDGMALGLRLHLTLEDQRLADTAMAENAAEAVVELGHGGLAVGRAIIPLRPDLELWDVAKVRSDTALLPLDSERLVVALEEEYAPARGRCQMVLTLAEW